MNNNHLDSENNINTLLGRQEIVKEGFLNKLRLKSSKLKISNNDKEADISAIGLTYKGTPIKINKNINQKELIIPIVKKIISIVDKEYQKEQQKVIDGLFRSIKEWSTNVLSKNDIKRMMKLELVTIKFDSNATAKNISNATVTFWYNKTPNPKFLHGDTLIHIFVIKDNIVQETSVESSK